MAHWVTFSIGRYRALSAEDREQLLGTIQTLGVAIPPGARSTWLDEDCQPAHGAMRFTVASPEQAMVVVKAFEAHGFNRAEHTVFHLWG